MARFALSTGEIPARNLPALRFQYAMPTLLANAPLWAILLRTMSGSSDATSVPATMMGVHMQTSTAAPSQPGDATRAARIVNAARAVVRRYANVSIAERDGYRLFHTEPVGQEEHYVNLRASADEKTGIVPERPGSLLYRHDAAGKTIVGVMYGAPGDATAAELDASAPLSVATWHRHIDFCVGPRSTSQTDPRFGFDGTLHTLQDCKAAGGYFVPLAFGWMTHVYPDRPASQVWGGETMAPMAMPQSTKDR